jgi:hypothetical protein
VCRCLRGAFRSASRVVSIKSFTGPSSGQGPFHLLPPGRQGASQGFLHHPPVDTELTRYAANRPLAMLILLPDSSTFALQSTAASILGFAHDRVVGSSLSGGAKSNDQKGPIQSSDINEECERLLGQKSEARACDVNSFFHERWRSG